MSQREKLSSTDLGTSIKLPRLSQITDKALEAINMSQGSDQDSKVFWSDLEENLMDTKAAQEDKNNNVMKKELKKKKRLMKYDSDDDGNDQISKKIKKKKKN